MKKCLRVCRGLLSVLFALIIVAGPLAVMPMPAEAAQTTKVEKKYEIAVVFDNSASMYTTSADPNNKSWCRAKYAMEIFASMLNYSKDKLKIYPMWNITVDGKSTTGGSYEALEIKSEKDIDKIYNLYTVFEEGYTATPLEPIIDAKKDLEKSDADEKWLIVLTDGDFNRENRNDAEFKTIDLRGELLSIAQSGVKVQYLGFGDAKNVQPDEANLLFAKKASDTSLKDDLINICNTIFQRSVLPANRLNGTTLNLDLSMKNLIVFVQGSDAKIVSLVDESGKEINVTLDSGQRKYSDKKANFYPDALVDESLAGQVVTFDACPKGKYTLNYTDADKIQIFYEPDVDIEVTLKNSDDIEVDFSSGEISSGEYTLTSKIVDRNTREDVGNHELMGNDVELYTYVKNSGQEDFREFPNGSTITFAPDDSTEVFVEGTYLGKYKISTKDDPNAFPLPIIVIEPSVDFKLNASVLQKDAVYKLNDFKNWKAIKVVATIEGQLLTEEQMAKTKLNVSASDGLAYRYEAVPAESAFYVYIGCDEGGKYVDTKTGTYTVTFTGTSYEDEHGKEHKAGNTAVKVEVASIAFAIKAEVLQDQNWYILKEHDEWKPVKVTVSADGKPLTDAQMANVKLNVSSSKDLSYRYEAVPGESAFNVYIGQDGKGKYVEPETGKYTLDFKGTTYTDEAGNKHTASDTVVEFEIQKYSKFWRVFMWILIILIIIAIWLIFMSQKVLPNRIDKDTADFETMAAGNLGGNYVSVDYKKKSQSLKISTVGAVDFNEKCSVSFKLKPVDNRFVKSKDRRIKIVGINSNCSSVSINNMEYIKGDKGAWVKETAADAATPPPIAHECRNPSFELRRESDARLECRVKNVK